MFPCQCMTGSVSFQTACLWELTKNGASTYYLRRMISYREISWTDHQLICQQEGGDLATVTSSRLGEKVLASATALATTLRGLGTSWWVAGSGNGTIDNSCLEFSRTGTIYSFSRIGICKSLLYSLCERRVKEIPCVSDADCHSNATCSHDVVTYRKFEMTSDVAVKTCTCNFGFYGNGSVCEEVD